MKVTAPGPTALSTPDLLGRRLVFVTGKGGVGKSTVAAGLALLAAERGLRVLVVEVDAKGNLCDFFEGPPARYTPTEVYRGVSVMAMDTEQSLQEYLALNLRLPMFARIGPLARVFEFVATAAPGVKEILTVGKIAWEVREALEGRAPWDLVVVDAAATGHIVAQLGAPEAIQELVQVGVVRTQTDWMAELLADPEITALAIVATPEEMPVNETIELVTRVRNELRVPLGAVVVNRVLPELFSRGEEATFEALREDTALARLREMAGPGAGDVVEAARLAVTLRRTRAAHLARLREAVDLPLLYLPYLFVRTHGLRVTRVVAESLGQELGVL
jgi:anion-transporting  ArsA/GET3 family ATPase